MGGRAASILSTSIYLGDQVLCELRSEAVMIAMDCFVEVGLDRFMEESLFCVWRLILRYSIRSRGL